MKGEPDNASKYTCQYCVRTFKYKRWFKTHKREHKIESQISKCKQGTNKSKSSKFKCKICMKPFNFKMCMQKNHAIETKPIIIEITKCRKCGYEATTKSDLNRHILQLHLETEKLYIFHSQGKDKNRYECTICGLKQKLGQIRTHLLSTHQLAMKNLRKFKCSTCDIEFQRMPILRKHRMDTHASKDLYLKCNLCDYESHSEQNMKRHNDNVHLKVRKTSLIKCHICNFTAKWIYQVKKHVISSHNEIVFQESRYKVHALTEENTTNRYECLICGLTNAGINSIKMHLLIKHNHAEKTKEKYKCTNCDFETSQLLKRARHIKFNHGSSEILYNCKICDFKGLTVNLLNHHTKFVHLKMKFQCNKCNYKVTTKSAIENHNITTHEGFRHRCKLCSFETVSPESLGTHLRKFHIEIPCRVCSALYPGIKNLKDHQRKEHTRRKRAYNKNTLHKSPQLVNSVLTSSSLPDQKPENTFIMGQKQKMLKVDRGGKVYFMEPGTNPRNVNDHISFEELENGEILSVN